MADNQIVFALLTFAAGEFLAVKVYSTEERALEGAATHVHASFNDDFVKTVSREGKEDDTQEFVDSMQALFAQKAWREFCECWDDYVASESFEGPSPANFDIAELEVDG